MSLRDEMQRMLRAGVSAQEAIVEDTDTPVTRIVGYIPMSHCIAFEYGNTEKCFEHGDKPCYTPMTRRQRLYSRWYDWTCDRRIALAKRIAGIYWPGDD